MFRDILRDEHSDWTGNAPATEEAIRELLNWAVVDLPKDYIEFFRVTDGGDGEFACYPEYVRLWPAAKVIDFNEGYEIQKWLPGIIGIGDNGGCDFVAFDTTSGEPYPIKSFLFAPMELAQAMAVAPNFEDFIKSLKRKPSE